MGTFSALLDICAGNSPVPGDFPAQKPVTQSFHVFFDLRLNKRLSKQSRGWWFETPSHPLWRHCNGSDVAWENIVTTFGIYLVHVNPEHVHILWVYHYKHVILIKLPLHRPSSDLLAAFTIAMNKYCISLRPLRMKYSFLSASYLLWIKQCNSPRHPE